MKRIIESKTVPLEIKMTTDRKLQYCYIDISTATSAGKTGIRVFPSEGRDVFFTDVIRDVDTKKGDIEKIILEAIEEMDRVRIIITREDMLDSKCIREYVDSNQAPEEMYENIMRAVKELSDEIVYYEALDNSAIVRAITEFCSGRENPSLVEFGDYLMENRIAGAKYNESSWRLEINHEGKFHLLYLDKWENSEWEKLGRNSPNPIYPVWFDELHRTLLIDAGSSRFNHVCMNGDLPDVSKASVARQSSKNEKPIQHAKDLAKSGYFELNDESTSLFKITSRGLELYELMKKHNFPRPIHG